MIFFLYTKLEVSDRTDDAFDYVFDDGITNTDITFKT